MDDYRGAVISLETMFNFLHKYHFLLVSLEPDYLASNKTFVFTDQLDFEELFTRDK